MNISGVGHVCTRPLQRAQEKWAISLLVEDVREEGGDQAEGRQMAPLKGQLGAPAREVPLYPLTFMDVAKDMQPWLDTPLHRVQQLHAAHALHLLGDPVQEACAGRNGAMMGSWRAQLPAPHIPGSSPCSLGDTVF